MPGSFWLGYNTYQSEKAPAMTSFDVMPSLGDVTQAVIQGCISEQNGVFDLSPCIEVYNKEHL